MTNPLTSRPILALIAQAMCPRLKPVDDGYVGQVDFRASASHDNWRVMTIFPAALDAHFSSGFAQRKLFDKFNMEIRSIGATEKMAIIFFPNKLDDDKRADARRNLIRYLTKLRYPIIWKEGGHGYEINKSGRIMRKWKLNTVYTCQHADHQHA